MNTTQRVGDRRDKRREANAHLKAPSYPDENELGTLLSFFNNGNFTDAELVALSITNKYPRADVGWKALGAIYAIQGRHADALAPMRKAVRLSPNDTEAHSNLGNVQQALGSHAQAILSYRTAIRLSPEFSVAHNNMGNAQKAIGRIDLAIESFQRAVSLNPDYADAHSNLGSALHEAARFIEAVDSISRALAIRPDFPEARNNLGLALGGLNKLDDAVVSFRTAIALNPNYADAYNNLGNTQHSLKQFDQAADSFYRAITIEPEFSDAYNNLGNILQALGRLDEAASVYMKALAIRPDYLDAFNNLGVALQGLGHLDDAVISFNKALRIKPDYPEALSNLGNALESLGRVDEAIVAIKKAVKLRPEYSEAHNNLGNALQSIGRYEEAVNCFSKALELNPKFADAFNNIGNAWQALGNLDEAASSLTRAVELKPDYSIAHSNLLFTLQHMNDISNAELVQAAIQFGESFNRSEIKDQEHSEIKKRSRLKIGLVSGDLRNHPVGFFIVDVLKSIVSDPSSRIDFVVFQTQLGADELTDRIKACCQSWHSAAGLSDEALAQLVKSHEIDILIDLSGHTAHNRLPMFAFRPAPVQVSWLGYFATTGLAEMDYFIADPWTAPAEEDALFVEELWRLPETYLCFSQPALDIDVGPLPAITEGHITFGCFNGLRKLNGKVIDLWVQILNAVPSSKLFLKCAQLKDKSTQDVVLKQFADRGIVAERLVLEGPSPRSELLASYNRVDIALDPFPYPGGTTSVESLWMGAPVITMKGDRFLARVGETIAQNIGMPEWIATSSDDYVAKAVVLSRDLNRLSSARAGLRQKIEASPLFDAPRFARHFSEAMWAMWQRRIEAESSNK